MTASNEGNDFGNDIITVSDDFGNDYVLEHLDTIEIDDVFYMAFLPADKDEEDDDYGIVILKVIEEDGEEILATVDDEDFLNKLYDRFMERLFEDDDIDEE